jgi:hypothetical protein
MANKSISVSHLSCLFTRIRRPRSPETHSFAIQQPQFHNTHIALSTSWRPRLLRTTIRFRFLTLELLHPSMQPIIIGRNSHTTYLTPHSTCMPTSLRSTYRIYNRCWLYSQYMNHRIYSSSGSVRSTQDRLLHSKT